MRREAGIGEVLRRALPPLLLCGTILALGIGLRAARGFHFPFGEGWLDDAIDLSGVLAAFTGAAVSEWWFQGPERVRERRWGLILSAVFGICLVLGQAPAAGVCALAIGALAIWHPSGNRPSGRLGDVLRASAATLSGVAGSALLMEMYEDLREPGGARTHTGELGAWLALLAFLGVAGAAALRAGEPGRALLGGRGRRKAAVMGVVGFLAVGLGVLLPAVAGSDLYVAGIIYHGWHNSLRGAMRWVSEAGGAQLPFWIMTGAVVVLIRRRKAFVHFLFLQVGVAGLSLAFKGLFQRQRPPFNHGMRLDSFPSGHVLAAVTLAGGLLVLLIPTSKTRGARIAACVFAATWPLVMALSRVYLGRHYPVDTLGSLLLGVAWICLAESMVQWVNAAPASQPEEAPE